MLSAVPGVIASLVSLALPRRGKARSRPCASFPHTVCGFVGGISFLGRNALLFLEMHEVFLRENAFLRT